MNKWITFIILFRLPTGIGEQMYNIDFQSLAAAYIESYYIY
jgi:hypothetical protein